MGKKHRKSENEKHRRASETNMGTIGRRLPHCRCFPGWDGGDVGDGGDRGDDYNLRIRNLRLYATGSTIDGDKFKTQILARQVGEIFRLMQKHPFSHKNISKYWWSRWSRRWRCSSWSETYRRPWAGALIIIKCRWQFFDHLCQFYEPNCDNLMTIKVFHNNSNISRNPMVRKIQAGRALFQ